MDEWAIIFPFAAIHLDAVLKATERKREATL
jgi:hypothetical protein